MDSEEKMTALKKAYADVIFNMSKESAARVMASERKAAIFEQELKATKEEGVRMLVRLKQMMDSKVREAEAAAMNQQNKIEELEAQLHEAEDIVRDLREELRETQDELERVKSDILKPANEPENSISREMPVGNRMYPYQSNSLIPLKSQDASSIPADVTMPYLSRKNDCRKCYNKVACVCGSFIGTRDLPSIIQRRKGRALYRNGCTQRIRACDRNLLEREEILSGKVAEVKDNKNDRKPEEDRHASKAPAKSFSELEKKLLGGVKIGGFESFPPRRKRTVSQRKPVRTSGGKQPVSLLELSPRTEPISVEESAKFGENPSKIVPRFSEHKAEPLSRSTESGESSEKENNLVEIDNVKNMEVEAKFELLNLKDEKFMVQDVVPLSEGTECAEKESDGKMEVENVNAHSLTNTCGTAEVVRIGERVIKYTFQRKRKRQALSKSDVNSSLEIETEKSMGDKPNGHENPEPPLSSIRKESSRDKRRMAQVARQLIALSENKWWH